MTGRGFGAVQIAARYEQLRFGSAEHPGLPSRSTRAANIFSASERVATFGVNWYLNQNYKWSVNYDVTSFEGGAPGGAGRPDEKAVFTRFGLQF